jgi:hypothetical protein
VMLKSAKGIKPKTKIQLQASKHFDETVKNDPENMEFKSNISVI